MDSDMILEQINMLQPIPDQDKYVLFEISSSSNRIYYGIDADKHPVFVLQTPNPQVQSQIQSTRKLILNSNINCEMVINEQVFEKNVHILTCLSSNHDEQLAFVRITESFSKHITTNNTHTLNDLFSALVNLFAQRDKVSEIELQGLFAELYTINYFKKLGINISSFWQKHNKMNFDFTINSIKRMEIKSTTQNNRIHHFKHEQLLSELYDIMIVSYLLRRDDSGISLYQLIREVRTLAAQDYSTLLYIEKLIKNIPEEVLQQLRYDVTYIENNIRFFPAANVPKFNEAQPNGVTQTEYNSDLTTAKHIPIESILQWINDKEEKFIV
jgi:hypothetical protein